MKKSWHPLLLKNQERVWLEEKKAVRVFYFIGNETKILTLLIFYSSRKRRSLTSFVRKRKRSANSRSYRGCRRSRRGRNDKRS